MKSIVGSELYQALTAIGLKCREPREGEIKNLKALNAEMSWLLADLPNEIRVHDPNGNTGWFFLQPSRAFASGVLLIDGGKVLLIGHDGGGSVLFISERMNGRVGLAYEVPDDIFSMTFGPKEEGRLYWDSEFLTWLHDFKDKGMKHFDSL